MNSNSTQSFEYWPGTNQILKPTGEVAKILGVHPNTVFRWVKSGKLECVRFGKKSMHFTFNQIIEFIESSKHKVKLNNIGRS